MRIAIAVDDALSEKMGGVGVYVLNLIGALLERQDEHRYVLVHSRSDFSFPLSSHPKIEKIVRIPLDSRLLYRGLWHFWRRPLVERFVGEIDVFHNPGLRYIPSSSPTIVTVHDLYPEVHPELFPKRGRMWRRPLMEQVTSTAEYILAVSEFTRRDLIQHLNASPERILVSPLAPPAEFHRMIDTPSTMCLPPYMPKTYFLFLGRSDYRKNLYNCLEAYLKLLQLTDDAPDFVVAGSSGEGGQDARILAQRDELRSRVYFLGYVSTQAAAVLMKGAYALVFPSRYEGFGLPLLEAMVCGTPILTSNVSCMPEIAQDAAIYCDPEDTDSISKAMLRMVSEPGLRRGLIRRGAHRVREFSWRTTAEVTVQAYEATQK